MINVECGILECTTRNKSTITVLESSCCFQIVYIRPSDKTAHYLAAATPPYFRTAWSQWSEMIKNVSFESYFQA